MCTPNNIIPTTPTPTIRINSVESTSGQCGLFPNNKCQDNTYCSDSGFCGIGPNYYNSSKSQYDGKIDDNRCGINYNNKKCKNKECCSDEGVCGITKDYCQGINKSFDGPNINTKCGILNQGRTCQNNACCSEYGLCSTDKIICSKKERNMLLFNDTSLYDGPTGTNEKTINEDLIKKRLALANNQYGFISPYR